MAIKRKQKLIDAIRVKSGNDDKKNICKSPQIKAMGIIRAIIDTDLR
jgi:hypothetical protein